MVMVALQGEGWFCHL